MSDGGGTVLLLEDAPEVFEVLKKVLGHLSISCLAVQTLADATNMWRSQKIDCIVLDLDIGWPSSKAGSQKTTLNGWKWLEECVLAQQPGFRGKVVIFSAYINTLREDIPAADLEGIEIIGKGEDGATRKLHWTIWRILGVSPA